LGGVARKKDAPFAERCSDALMYVVQVAVNNRIGTRLREKSLQPLLYGSLVES
jgi:hypothetical protein